MVERITIKRIKRELEFLKTLDEKKQHLENYLKKIKSAKLKLQIEKLLSEAETHLEHEKGLAKEETIEQKLVTGTPSATEITTAETISAAGFEPIKYVPRKESELESTAGQAVITPAQAAVEEQRKYIKAETFSAMYTEARDKINTFREYLTKDLGVDLRTINRDPTLTREVEDHLVKAFGLNTASMTDQFRLQNYKNMLQGKVEEVMKYKR